MTFPTIFSNIKITNNKISGGKNSNNTVYGYSDCASIQGIGQSTCNITGNSFSGVNTNGIMLGTLPSAVIANNQFLRGSTSISAYISGGSIYDQHITDNFFDGYTVNGTNENLVTGLTETSVYTRNKNQIEYIPIDLSNQSVYVTTSANTDTAFSETLGGNATVRRPNSYLWYIVETNASANALNLKLDLNNILPKGITLQQCKIGLFATNNGGAELGNGSAPNNTWQGTLISKSVQKQNYTAGTNSILDPQTNLTTTNETVSFTYDPITPFNDDILTTAPHYETLTPTTQSFFVNNSNNLLSLRFVLNLRTTTLGSGLSARISPVVAKCIW